MYTLKLDILKYNKCDNKCYFYYVKGLKLLFISRHMKIVNVLKVSVTLAGKKITNC